MAAFYTLITPSSDQVCLPIPSLSNICTVMNFSISFLRNRFVLKCFIYLMRNGIMVPYRSCLLQMLCTHIQLSQRSGFKGIISLTLSHVVPMARILEGSRQIAYFWVWSVKKDLQQEEWVCWTFYQEFCLCCQAYYNVTANSPFKQTLSTANRTGSVDHWLTLHTLTSLTTLFFMYNLIRSKRYRNGQGRCTETMS